MAKTREQCIDELRQVCTALGWVIGLDESEDGIYVSGLVIGTEEYVEGILDQLEEKDNYAIYDTKGIIQEIQ